MAKINQKAFNLVKGNIRNSAKVGHNRTVNNTTNCGFHIMECRLHGHAIVRFRSDGAIILNHCDYMTTTTREAMQDFLQAYTGVWWSVSFAKGKFSVNPGTGYEELGDMYNKRKIFYPKESA